MERALTEGMRAVDRFKAVAKAPKAVVALAQRAGKSLGGTVLELAGVGCVVRGAFEVSLIAGWITAGVGLVVCGLAVDA